MNIAVADDEKLIMREMVYLVGQVVPDAHIDGFQDVDKLLEKAREIKYDVAFLDIQMPKKTGVELAKELKLINPEINIIFATSYSEYTPDAIKLHASGYLQKPATKEEIAMEMENLLHPVGKTEKPRIYVQTFGNFAVLVDNKPIVFKRGREGEMLAYLVDRHGSPVSRKELASVIFEEGDFSRNQQVYLSAIAHDLAEDLELAGASEMFGKSGTSYFVDISKFSCDSYDFLKGDTTVRFSGEYMEQYSWAEYYKEKFFSKS